MLKKTVVALSVATLATSAVALPTAVAKAADTSVQLAACNPCNPCAAAKCNPCNPCAAAKNPCNPCNPCAAAKNPCNPCNPCAAKNPCNPCKANGPTFRETFSSACSGGRRVGLHSGDSLSLG